MNTTISPTSGQLPVVSTASRPSNEPNDQEELRDAFGRFVGETFFSHLISAMRKSVGKPAYLHGGHAEEVFQSQLDQMLVENIAESSAESFSGPMFELFTLQRTT